jgi:hypothetical protein
MAKLTNNEKCPYTDIVRLSFSDLLANKTAIQAGTYQIATIPAGGTIDLVTVAKPEVFTVTASGAIAVSVGTTSGTSATEFLSAAAMGGTSANIAPVSNTGSVFALAPGASYSQATASTVKAGATPAPGYGSSTPVYLYIPSTINASETAGVIVIGLKIIDTAQYLS